MQGWDGRGVAVNRCEREAPTEREREREIGTRCWCQALGAAERVAGRATTGTALLRIRPAASWEAAASEGVAGFRVTGPGPATTATLCRCSPSLEADHWSKYPIRAGLLRAGSVCSTRVAPGCSRQSCTVHVFEQTDVVHSDPWAPINGTHTCLGSAPGASLHALGLSIQLQASDCRAHCSRHLTTHGLCILGVPFIDNIICCAHRLGLEREEAAAIAAPLFVW